MKNDKDVSVIYEKIYTDDVSVHIPELFANKKIAKMNVNRYWENAIDGFYNYSKCTHYLSCTQGNLRFVIANDIGSNNYKFNQFFVSAMDGKIIKVPPGNWFGIHNLYHGPSVLMAAKDIDDDDEYDRLSYKIFNWHAKRA